MPEIEWGSISVSWAEITTGRKYGFFRKGVEVVSRLLQHAIGVLTDEPSTLILAQATKFSCVPLRIPPCPQRFHFYRKGAEGCLQGAKEFPSSPSCCTFSPSWLVFFNRRGNRGFAEDAEDDVSVSFNNPLLIRFIFAFVKIPFIDSRNDITSNFILSPTSRRSSGGDPSF